MISLSKDISEKYSLNVIKAMSALAEVGLFLKSGCTTTSEALLVTAPLVAQWDRSLLPKIIKMSSVATNWTL